MKAIAFVLAASVLIQQTASTANPNKEVKKEQSEKVYDLGTANVQLANLQWKEFLTSTKAKPDNRPGELYVIGLHEYRDRESSR